MSKSKYALGALIAGVGGYIVGVLTAPKSGKDTREDVKQIAVHKVREAEKNLKKVHTELNTLVTEVQKTSTDITSKASEELRAAINKALIVKERARHALSSVHDGDTDDNELQSAIDEATRAIDNLRKITTKNDI